MSAGHIGQIGHVALNDRGLKFRCPRADGHPGACLDHAEPIGQLLTRLARSRDVLEAIAGHLDASRAELARTYPVLPPATIA